MKYRPVATLVALVLVAASCSPSAGLAEGLPGDGTAGIRRYDIGGAPQSIAVGPSTVWVSVRSAQNAHELWRIDPTTDHVERVPAGQGALDIALGAGAVWVVCSDGDNPCRGPALLKIDPGSGDLLETIHTGGQGRLSLGLGYVWDSTTNGLLKVAPADGRVLATFSCCNDVAVAGDTLWGRVLQVPRAKDQPPRESPDTGAVFRVNPDTGETLASIAFGDPCRFIASAKTVWISSCDNGMREKGSKGKDVLQAIDASTARTKYRVSIPMWGDMVESGDTLWISGHLPGYQDQPINLLPLAPGTGRATGPALVLERGKPRNYPFEITCGLCGVPTSAVAPDGEGGLWLTDPVAGQVIHVADPRALQPAPSLPPAPAPSVAGSPADDISS